MTRKTSFEPVSTTRKNQFELVTTSFNDKNKHSFNNDKEKQVWARKNWLEQVTKSFNNQEEPVWVSHSRFQWQWKTSLSQILEELVCLCHAQQLVSTTSHNQIEQVSTTRKNQFWASHNQFQSQGKMVWASYSQFQQAVRTRKNQFFCLCHAQEPVSITSHNQFELSFNNQEEPVLS